MNTYEMFETSISPNRKWSEFKSTTIFCCRFTIKNNKWTKQYFKCICPMSRAICTFVNLPRDLYCFVDLVNLRLGVVPWLRCACSNTRWAMHGCRPGISRCMWEGTAPWRVRNMQYMIWCAYENRLASCYTKCYLKPTKQRSEKTHANYVTQRMQKHAIGKSKNKKQIQNRNHKKK